MEDNIRICILHVVRQSVGPMCRSPVAQVPTLKYTVTKLLCYIQAISISGCPVFYSLKFKGRVLFISNYFSLSLTPWQLSDESAITDPY